MKKKSIWFLFLLFWNCFLFSEEYSTIQVLSQPYSISGNVEYVMVMHDMLDGFYVAYVENKTLKVLHGSAGVEILMPYNPYINGYQITNVRELQTTSGGSVGQLGAFLGTENGIEHIYLFYVNALGHFTIRQEWADIDGSQGPIDQFQISDIRDGFLYAYYLRAGILYSVRYPVEIPGSVQGDIISVSGEIVKNFNISQFRHAEEGLIYGWYISRTTDREGLVLFTRKNDITWQRVSAGYLPIGIDTHIDVSMAPLSADAVNYYTKIGAVTEVYFGDTNGIRSEYRFSNTNIRNFYDLDFLGIDKDLMIFRNGERISIHFVKKGLDTDVSESQVVIDSIENPKLAVFPLDVSHIMIVAFTEGWKSVVIDIRDSNILTTDIPVGIQTSVLLHSDYLDIPRVVFYDDVSDSDDHNGRIVTLIFKEGQWIAERSMNIDMVDSEILLSNVDVPHLPTFTSNGDIVVSSISSSGLLFIDLSTEHTTFIRTDLHAWSRRINRKMLLSVFVNNKIMVYGYTR